MLFVAFFTGATVAVAFAYAMLAVRYGDWRFSLCALMFGIIALIGVING